MSNLMLIGVLKMPPDLWTNDTLNVSQRYSQYIEAANRIEELERMLRFLVNNDSINDNYGSIGKEIKELLNT